MDVRKICICVVVTCCAISTAQYEVPDALIEALSPKGFRVSIPDENGIKLFAFHGKLNEELNGREGGTYSRDIIKAKNGRWTFEDKYTVLKPGDVLYYWTYVDYFDGARKLGYTNDDQIFKVTELIRDPSAVTTTPKPTTKGTTISGCPASATKVKGKKICGGKVILQENFGNNFLTNEKKWEKELVFAGEPDYEFVLYNDGEENIYVSKNILHIKPTLTDSRYGENYVTTPDDFDLGIKCTGVVGSQQCVQRPWGAFIIPPVLSARINTKNYLSFTYGTVEVRAKFPKGDWIYPEIFLNPKNQEYGAGYESGQIRIAFVAGNEGLNKKLYGGCILGNTTAARNFAMKSTEGTRPWTDDFHVYKVKWEPESITLSVDGEIYGVVYPSAGGFATKENELQLSAAHRWRAGTVFAPFDQEMFVTIGVGVGGHSFPDAGSSKPWINNDPKAQKLFYRSKDTWHPTWSSDSVLQVDYIKVSAL